MLPPPPSLEAASWTDEARRAHALELASRRVKRRLRLC